MAKPPKARLYKMVTLKTSVSLGAGKSVAKSLKDVQLGQSIGYGKVVSSFNSIGASLNSLAIGLQSHNQLMADAFAEKQRAADKIQNTRQNMLRAEKNRLARLDREEKKRQGREADQEAEEKAEEKTPAQPEKEKKKKQFLMDRMSGSKGFFGFFRNLGMKLFAGLVAYGAFKWVINNPDKVEKLAKGLLKIGEFLVKATSFLVGGAIDGMIKFLENPISLKGLFGITQFLINLAPIVVGISFLKNPMATVKAVGWFFKTVGGVFSFLGKGLKFFLKMRKMGALGKGLAAIGAGTAAAVAVNMEGGSAAEAVGAGVGAGAGTAIGSAIGEATGIPGMGMLAGAAGGFLGGKVGGGIGKMIEPIFEPFKRLFDMIKEVFDSVLDAIKEPFEEFFTQFAGVMNTVLDAVEPHLPLIKKITGFAFKAAFAPLLLLMKGLTMLLKFFNNSSGDKKTENQNKQDIKANKPPDFKPPELEPVDNSSDVEQMSIGGILSKGISMAKSAARTGMDVIRELQIKKLMSSLFAPQKSMFFFMKKLLDITLEKHELEKKQSEGGGEEMAKGGKVKLPQRAKGGWIKGPHSGYPVSLDGGKTTSFIGHGTEYVGFHKNDASKAFVIPFDTPATKTNKGLTQQRFQEAKRSGYGLPKLPGFAAGGYFMPKLPKFAEGGEFNPTDYKKDTLNSGDVVVNDKTYYVRYTKNEGNIVVKQINKVTKSGFLGFGQETEGVDPASDEFKEVAASDNFKSYVRNAHAEIIPGSQGSRQPYQIESVETDPQAEIAYYYDKSYQQNYDAWREKGLSHKEAQGLAARAAKEFSLEATDSQGDTMSALPGAKDDVTGEPLQAAAPEALKNVEVVSPPPEKKGGDGKKSFMDAGIEAVEAALRAIGTAFEEGAAASGDTLESLQKSEEDSQNAFDAPMSGTLTPEQTKDAFSMTEPLVINPTTTNNISGGGGDNSPVLIPNNDVNVSDPYLIPNFGILTETKTPVNALW